MEVRTGLEGGGWRGIGQHTQCLPYMHTPCALACPPAHTHPLMGPAPQAAQRQLEAALQCLKAEAEGLVASRYEAAGVEAAEYHLQLAQVT